MTKVHVAVAVIKNTDNDILILYHNKLNKISLPMGKVDKGESAESTLDREMFEELDIKITKKQHLYTFNIITECNTKTLVVDLFKIIDYKGIPINKEIYKHKFIAWANKPHLTMLKENNELDLILHNSLSFNILN